MPTLDEIASAFRGADRDLRVQLLLDYGRRLPPLPARFQPEREAHRVHECMTPLFVWVEPGADGTVRLCIDVAEEAPTVRGIAGVLVAALDGAPRDAYERLPEDLVAALALDDVIRMNRVVGIAGLVGRIRRGAQAA